MIDFILHAQGVVQRGAERLTHPRRGGFDGAVEIQVAGALGGQEHILHNLSVIHCRSLPVSDQRVKLLENLAVLVRQRLGLAAEHRVLQCSRGVLALLGQKLGVPQRVFHIKNLFRGHGFITSRRNWTGKHAATDFIMPGADEIHTCLKKFLFGEMAVPQKSKDILTIYRDLV